MDELLRVRLGEFPPTKFLPVALLDAVKSLRIVQTSEVIPLDDCQKSGSRDAQRLGGAK